MQFIIHVSTLITNQQEQILCVHEKKEQVFNKLNLLGGHLELREGLIEGAKREVREEVGVEVKIEGLIGIYTGQGKDHYIHFIFSGTIISGTPVANKNEIHDCGWYSEEEIQKMPEDQILTPKKLKKVIADYKSGKLGSLDFITEMIYPTGGNL